MDEKRVADYFALLGLPLDENPSPIDDYINEASLKLTHKQDPITDITVINKSFGEMPPKGYKCLEFTPSGFPADLNHGSIRAAEMYLCYRREDKKLPLVDIGVLYESKDSKERVMQGCEIISLTPYGRSANVNNTGNTRIYITFRRATNNLVSNYDSLAVMDISVILLNKGEVAPHSYCTINKSLNKGMMGSDVYLCYKKSYVKKHYLTYKPVVLSRYPVEDNADISFPERMAMFALPLGSTIEARPHSLQPPTPIFSTFVLTTGKQAQKVYGASILFYEQFDESKLNGQQKITLGIDTKSYDNESGFVSNHQEADENTDVGSDKSVDIMHSKSICILSRAPFFDAFKKFLFFLLDIIKSGEHDVPIERHIAHFLKMIPMPSPARPRIMIQLSTLEILLTYGNDIPLPKSGASFVETLKTLGPHNCIQLLLCVLFEQKILIHSLQPATMTSVAETAISMIFPFTWQCPYVPSCPLNLSYILNSPTPFILGIDSRFFDMYDPPSDVVCIDLDTNTLTLSDDRKGFNIKLLPKKPVKVLRSTLERLYEQLQLNHVLHKNSQLEDNSPALRYFMQMEILIHEAFLRFMACVLKGYNLHLRPITRAPTNTTTDIDSLFDIVGFVKSRDKSYTKFYALLIKTQTFSRFIEERSFVQDRDSCLTFFDECLDRVDENKDDPRLIEIDTSLSDSERTVFIMPPEPDLKDQQIYKYTIFPILNPEYFPKENSSLPCIGGSKNSSGVQNFFNSSSFSPMTRRTPHEVKTSQKIAIKHATIPSMWPKYLSWHSYSLWFIHLTSYVQSVRSKAKLLRKAMEVLVEMQKCKIQPPDEVCYRILMQLCGIYHQPVLAVKILFEMKKQGIIPNATTYGFYNKAVLDCKWPTSGSSSYQLWRKLRNTIIAVHKFKQPLLAINQSHLAENNTTPEFDEDLRMDEIVEYDVPGQRNSILIRDYSVHSLKDEHKNDESIVEISQIDAKEPELEEQKVTNVNYIEHCDDNAATLSTPVQAFNVATNCQMIDKNQMEKSEDLVAICKADNLLMVNQVEDKADVVALKKKKVPTATLR